MTAISWSRYSRPRPQITEGGAKSLDYGIMRFARNDLKMPAFEPRQRRKVGLESRPSADILFSDDPAEAAELQWRISPALAAVVLGLLAIPLSHSAPREGRSGRAVLGIFAYVVYVNVLYMSRNWIATGDIPPVLGTWWVHALVLLAAVGWMQRQGRMVGRG
jgi:lipopolysaccharide export system permease protein